MVRQMGGYSAISVEPGCWEQRSPPPVCCTVCLTAFLLHTKAEEPPAGQATCSCSHSASSLGLDSYLFNSRSGIHRNTGACQNTYVSWLERSPGVNGHFSREAADRPWFHRRAGLLILSCREYWGNLRKKGPSPMETLGTDEPGSK